MRVHESLRAFTVCAFKVGSSRMGSNIGSVAGALLASAGPYRGSAPGLGILQKEFAERRLTATTCLNFGQTGVNEGWGAAVVVSATRACLILELSFLARNLLTVRSFQSHFSTEWTPFW